VLEAFKAHVTKLEVRLAGEAMHLLSSDEREALQRKDAVIGACESGYQAELQALLDKKTQRSAAELDRMRELERMIEENDKRSQQAKLQMLLKPDKELVDLANADASNEDDKKNILAFIRGKEGAIESLVARLIRDHVCGADAVPRPSSVQIDGSTIDLTTERVDLSGRDLSQPLTLLKLAKWLRLKPAVVHLKLNGCKLDDTSVRLLEISAKEDALPQLRVSALPQL
jgi:hypothetical protein